MNQKPLMKSPDKALMSIGIQAKNNAFKPNQETSENS